MQVIFFCQEHLLAWHNLKVGLRLLEYVEASEGLMTPEQVLIRLVEHYKAWAVNGPGGHRSSNT
jgi:hypothetical protein